MDEYNAKKALVYYMQKAWEAAGLKWYNDNTVEVEGIIDDIIGAEKAD